MIEVRGLIKYFKEVPVLKGIDMNVKKGEIYGFIGQNGAGKSTTMNILAGLSKPTKGKCVINGMNVATIPAPGVLEIGYLPEEPKFYSWMSAEETLRHLVGKHERVGAIAEVLHWVGLEQVKDRKVGGFSRGMKQRLGIAAAMINDPPLLILDEPSSALDPEGRASVLGLITELKEMGKTVLFSTHILSDAERVCDTVGFIAGGRMVFEKPLTLLQKRHIHPIFDITLWETNLACDLMELKKVDGITDIRLSGEKLVVSALDEVMGSKAILNFFAAKDIPLRSFSIRESSLEELFIKELRSA